MVSTASPTAKRDISCDSTRLSPSEIKSLQEDKKRVVELGTELYRDIKAAMEKDEAAAE